jgi:hypothetical protein
MLDGARAGRSGRPWVAGLRRATATVAVGTGLGDGDGRSGATPRRTERTNGSTGNVGDD